MPTVLYRRSGSPQQPVGFLRVADDSMSVV